MLNSYSLSQGKPSHRKQIIRSGPYRVNDKKYNKKPFIKYAEWKTLCFILWKTIKGLKPESNDRRHIFSSHKITFPPRK